ncbi:MAG TPA: hydroxyacid dehydrogenase [Phycisphaerae bacterium]|nr:hydroxyacid dehydrogenase [Phycisphaerae bacterium]HPC21917.1 hydroxyacid dehydrogenase [Phycisphaerae bacterium]HRS27516.1 hydroxyacid dehydrogenase [Phycisphaerae bacterium]HRT42235.1 hydroxyacid dehydrogenase [Phycisphaerae bacterium]
MKIAAFEVESWERVAFEQLALDFDVRYTDRRLDLTNADDYADAEVICTFIYSKLDKKVLSRFKDLRFICTRSTGFDHIDTAFCEAHNILVSNVPSYGDRTVAEHVFGLLLTISHQLYDAIDRTRKGDFSLVGLRGFQLYGRTLGVIGAGNIGLHVIRIARGFGMRVLAYDVRPRPDLAVQIGFEYRPFEEVLAAADVLSLHVPDTPETRDMIGQEQFARMKQGVVLINTARGSIVNVQALMEALAAGKVRAAGLDVLPEEPMMREEAELLHRAIRTEHDLETLLADHILLRQRNVFVTPHSAFCTEEAVQQILEVTRENIEAFARGAPQNVVIGDPAALRGPAVPHDAGRAGEAEALPRRR